MNLEQAKLVLSASRPDGRDETDPVVREALAAARQNPALAEWFECQQAHDRVVSAKLADIRPPAGLREAILAQVGGGVPVQRTPFAWWRSVVFAAAAAFAVLLSLAVNRLQPVGGGASFEDFAVNVVDHGFFLEKRGDNVAELKAWLTARSGPIPGELPAEFARLRALGCRTLAYRGHDVSLVCFERDGKEYHVFVARRSDLKEAAATGTEPRFLEQGKLVAATWSDASNHFVVVTDATMAALKSVL